MKCQPEYLNASMGFFPAALFAGYRPNTIPIIPQNTAESSATFPFIETVIPVPINCPIIFRPAKEQPIPATQPAILTIRASNRN